MPRLSGDNSSKEDMKTIADARRDVWTSGFKGLGIGATAGYILHTVSRTVYTSLHSNQSAQKLLFPGSEKLFRFNKNTAIVSMMAGGALGSFGLATTTGKKAVHQMYDIFNIAKNDDKAYGNQNVEECDVESRRSRRLSRRKTISKRMLEGQGLSDSHGGIWLTEETESEQRSRRSRRQVAMAKRLDEE